MSQPPTHISLRLSVDEVVQNDDVRAPRWVLGEALNGHIAQPHDDLPDHRELLMLFALYDNSTKAEALVLGRNKESANKTSLPVDEVHIGVAELVDVGKDCTEPGRAGTAVLSGDPKSSREDITLDRSEQARLAKPVELQALPLADERRETIVVGRGRRRGVADCELVAGGLENDSTGHGLVEKVERHVEGKNGTWGIPVDL